MTEYLTSWRDTATRRAIVEFVAAVTDPGGPDFVPAEGRIAVFDNDGTLWTEKPMPTQLHYLLEQWKAQAAADPTLAEKQPYKAAVTGDLGWLGAAIDKHYAGDDTDLGMLVAGVAAATSGTSVEEYEASVAAFYRDARHLTLNSSYAHTVYQPMVELVRLLDAHHFRTYIVSGGERDFMRPMTQDYYGIPTQRVIGTSLGLSYDAEDNVVRYAPKLDFFDDGPQSRFASGPGSDAGRFSRSATPTATSRCSGSPKEARAAWPCCYATTTTVAATPLRQRRRGSLGRGPRARVHRHQRPRRLGAGLPWRVSRPSLVRRREHTGNRCGSFRCPLPAASVPLGESAGSSRASTVANRP